MFAQKRNQRNGWVVLNDKSQNALALKSIESLSITHGGSAVSEPIEEGSFTSYNKTTEPISIELEAMMQGETTALQSALTRLSELQNSVEKLSISTPYYEYQNMTLESFDYEMSTTNGLGMLAVKLSLVEVRESAAAYSEVSADAITASQAASASDVSVIDTGSATTQTPTAEEMQAGERAEEMVKKKSLAKEITDWIKG